MNLKRLAMISVALSIACGAQFAVADQADQSPARRYCAKLTHVVLGQGGSTDLRDFQICLENQAAIARLDAAHSVGCGGYPMPTPAIVAARRAPEAVRVVKSAELCLQQLVKVEALAAIAKERKYAKRYKVLDLREINSNKFEIEQAEEKMAAAREALAPLGGPLACASPFVADVMSCEIPDQKDVIRGTFNFDACQCAGRGLPGLP
jgi:hypothetical protein